MKEKKKPGRPKEEETVVRSFRINKKALDLCKEKYDDLNQKVNNYIKRLSKRHV